LTRDRTGAHILEVDEFPSRRARRRSGG
jgi:hypothetical protein